MEEGTSSNTSCSIGYKNAPDANDLSSWNAHGGREQKTIDEVAELGPALQMPDALEVVPRRTSQPDPRGRETRLARMLAVRCQPTAHATNSAAFEAAIARAGIKG